MVDNGRFPSDAASRREFTPASIKMLIASIVSQLLGGTMAIGLFPLIMLPAMQTLSWNGAEIGSMAGAFMICAAIGLPISGYLVDRFGPRIVVLCGTAITGFALFSLAAQSGWLSQGYLSFAVAGLASSISVAHVKAQAMRFDRYRGIVLAILGMTVGVSFGLTPLFGKLVLDAYGWRAVYLVFGFLPLCISLPILAAWFHNQRIDLSAPGLSGGAGLPLSAALRSGRFWMIVVMATGSAFVFAGMQVHFIAFLQERAFSNQRAVNVLSIAVFGGLACQLLTGWLLDRFRTPHAAMPFVGIALIGMLLLIASPTIATTTAGVILLQSGVGGELSIIPYLVSRAFGTAQLARIFGVVMLIAQVLSGASPLMMGVVHDRTGSYTIALPLFVFLLTISLLLLFLLGRGTQGRSVPGEPSANASRAI